MSESQQDNRWLGDALKVVRALSNIGRPVVIIRMSARLIGLSPWASLRAAND